MTRSLRRIALLSASILAFLALSTRSWAEEWASVAYSNGVGRIEIFTDYWLFQSGKDYIAKIPSAVREDTRIPISYDDHGKLIEATFYVAAISVSGDLCRLHDKVPDSSSTIYVRPCTYQK